MVLVWYGIDRGDDNDFQLGSDDFVEHTCATGPTLPTTGYSSFRVRFNPLFNINRHFYVGVCDEARRNFWALRLDNGRMVRYGRVPGTLAIVPAAFYEHRLEPLPAGWPNGKRVAVVPPHELHSTAFGMLEVKVLVGNGHLAFGIKRYGQWRLYKALSGFPPSAALRPWVRLRNYGDKARMDKWFEHADPEDLNMPCNAAFRYCFQDTTKGYPDRGPNEMPGVLGVDA